MNKLLRSLFVGAAIAALATAVWSQPVTNQTISGNECWNAGQGPGGPSQFLCINQVRDGTALALFSGAGTTPTTTMTNQQGTLYWTGGAATTWAIVLPNPAFDGEIVTVDTDTTLTTRVTVTAAVTPQNQTVPAFSAATVTALTPVQWQFNLATLAWVRLR
jgi:hypothetical protein